MRIGITGHQKLDRSDSWEWVRKELDRFLLTTPKPLIGISSLAVGADQLFAGVVLDQGGLLEIVVPFLGYEATFSNQHDRAEYYRLLKRASKTEVLEERGSPEESYLASGKKMVDHSELVISVWDGKPAIGLGGTGDIVAYAKRRHKKILHINPVRHQVSELQAED